MNHLKQMGLCQESLQTFRIFVKYLLCPTTQVSVRGRSSRISIAQGRRDLVLASSSILALLISLYKCKFNQVSLRFENLKVTINNNENKKCLKQ